MKLYVLEQQGKYVKLIFPSGNPELTKNMNEAHFYPESAIGDQGEDLTDIAQVLKCNILELEFTPKKIN